ncbi:MAG: energy transducer TonB, partial [Desulfovibrionales bacterium]|nr:energy transducer TonB [Desulfovibrionales bacterium]
VSGSPGSAEMGPGSEETLARAEPGKEAFLPPAVERPPLSDADLPVPTVVEPTPEVVKKVEPKPVPKPVKKKQPTATPKKVEKEQPRTPTTRPEEKSELSAQADVLAPDSSGSAANNGQVANTGASNMGSGNGGRGQAEKQHSGSGSGGHNGREAGLVKEYVRNNFNYILVRVRRNLDYPAQARRMGFSGVCKYSFAINMDGQISELEVVESSGHHVLDEAGKKAIVRSLPFPVPPIPARIIMPIKFSLTG